MIEMEQITAFEELQINICKFNMKNAKSIIDRDWYGMMLHEYVTCLRKNNKEVRI